MAAYLNSVAFLAFVLTALSPLPTIPLAPGWESGEHKYHGLPTSEVLQGHCADEPTSNVLEF